MAETGDSIMDLGRYRQIADDAVASAAAARELNVALIAEVDRLTVRTAALEHQLWVTSERLGRVAHQRLALSGPLPSVTHTPHTAALVHRVRRLVARRSAAHG